VLRSGCRWRDLDIPGVPSGVTHWRRFRFRQERSKLLQLWRFTLSQLVQADAIQLSRAVIDGTLAASFAFTDTTGYSGKHHCIGTKLETVTGQEGLPVAITFASGNRHDLSLAVPTLKRVKVGNRRRPTMLLADKGFDSQTFRRHIRTRGIKANIPERTYRKRRKRGRPPLYDTELGKQRYVVERTNAWLKSFRRVHFRYDRTLASFRAFVLLACIVVCLRRLIL